MQMQNGLTATALLTVLATMVAVTFWSGQPIQPAEADEVAKPVLTSPKQLR